jgi:hypothetical protein
LRRNYSGWELLIVVVLKRLKKYGEFESESEWRFCEWKKIRGNKKKEGEGMILWMNECAAVRFKEEFDIGVEPLINR